jgi:hypothetical protein
VISGGGVPGDDTGILEFVTGGVEVITDVGVLDGCMVIDDDRGAGEQDVKLITIISAASNSRYLVKCNKVRIFSHFLQTQVLYFEIYVKYPRIIRFLFYPITL